MTIDELRPKFEAWFRSKFTRWSPNKSGGIMAWLGYQQGHTSRDAEVEALRRKAFALDALVAAGFITEAKLAESLNIADAAMREESK